VRLDTFLKTSRLCLRRAVAQQLCDAGFVLLNGRPVKSPHVVKMGDEIVLRRRDAEIVARVVAVPASSNVSRRDAKQLVEILAQKHLDPLRLESAEE